MLESAGARSASVGSHTHAVEDNSQSIQPSKKNLNLAQKVKSAIQNLGKTTTENDEGYEFVFQGAIKWVASKIEAKTSNKEGASSHQKTAVKIDKCAHEHPFGMEASARMGRSESSSSTETSPHGSVESLPPLLVAAAKDLPPDALSSHTFTDINVDLKKMKEVHWLNGEPLQRKDAEALVPFTKKTPMFVRFLAIGDMVGFGNGKVEQNASQGFKLNRDLNKIFADGKFNYKNFAAFCGAGPSKKAVVYSDDTVESRQLERAIYDAAVAGSKELKTASLDLVIDDVVIRQLALTSRIDKAGGDPAIVDRGNGGTKKGMVINLSKQLVVLLNNEEALAKLEPKTQNLLRDLKERLKENTLMSGSGPNEFTAATFLSEMNSALKSSKSNPAKLNVTDLIETLSRERLIDISAQYNPADPKSGTGCGAAMRSAPVGMFFAEMVRKKQLTPQEGLEGCLKMALRTGASTHASPIAFVPAAYHAGMIYLMATEDLSPANAHTRLMQSLSLEGESGDLFKEYMQKHVNGSSENGEAFEATWKEATGQLDMGRALRQSLRENPSEQNALLRENSPEGVYHFGLQFSRNYASPDPLLSRTEEGNITHLRSPITTTDFNNSSAAGYWPGRNGDDVVVMSHEVLWKAVDGNTAFRIALTMDDGSKDITEYTKSEFQQAFGSLSRDQKEAFISDVLRIGGFHNGDSDSTACIAGSLLAPLLGEENLKDVFKDLQALLSNTSVTG